jgi:glucose/arabinose dehydrogenase
MLKRDFQGIDKQIFVLFFMTLQLCLHQTLKGFPLHRHVSSHWLVPFIWTSDIIILQNSIGLADSQEVFWQSAHPVKPTSISSIIALMRKNFQDSRLPLCNAKVRISSLSCGVRPVQGFSLKCATKELWLTEPSLRWFFGDLLETNEVTVSSREWND